MHAIRTIRLMLSLSSTTLEILTKYTIFFLGLEGGLDAC